MRDGTLTVDEGVEDGTQQICLTLDITGGGSVQCPLTVTLGTTAGTASMFKSNLPYLKGMWQFRLKYFTNNGNLIEFLH